MRLAGYVVGILLAVGVLALGFWLATRWKDNSVIAIESDNTSAENAPATPADVWQRTLVSEEGLVDQIGVRIVYVAITADGGLIDLRYQVVDPDKANILHESETYPPILIDEATGAVVDQLLMGHSHTGDMNAGQTYYLIFENPGNLVQPGSSISVLLGDAELEHVVVK